MSDSDITTTDTEPTEEQLEALGTTRATSEAEGLELLESLKLPAIAISYWRMTRGLCVIESRHGELENFATKKPDSTWMCRFLAREDGRWKWGAWCVVPGRFLEARAQRLRDSVPTRDWLKRLEIADLPPIGPSSKPADDEPKKQRKRMPKSKNPQPTPPPAPDEAPAEVGLAPANAAPEYEHEPAKSPALLDVQRIPTALVRVDKSRRIRQELGNISALAKSIKTLGQFTPIVLDSAPAEGWEAPVPGDPETYANNLVAGERRLRACEELGIDVAFVRCSDEAAEVLRALDIEAAENTEREDLKPSEMVRYRAMRLPLLQAAAAKRQEQGRIEGGKASSKAARAASGAGAPEAKSVSDEENRAATQAAKQAGFESRRQGDRAEYVVKMAEANPAEYGKHKADMDRTGNISGAFKAIKRSEQAKQIASEPPPLPTGPFRVIAADPSWLFEKRAGDITHRGVTPYPGMTVEQICALPVAKLAHRDSILWLWIPNALLLEHEQGQLLSTVHRVLQAWGFKPKALLTWVKIDKAGKPRMANGDWLRNCTEQCVLAVRGKPTITLTNQKSVIEAPPGKREGVEGGEHSAKPDEFFKLVESLCPGSKVELFSRSKRKGWTVWGDQAPKAAPAVKGAKAGIVESSSLTPSEQAVYDRAVKRLKQPTSIPEVARILGISKPQASALVKEMKRRQDWPGSKGAGTAPGAARPTEKPPKAARAAKPATRAGKAPRAPAAKPKGRTAKPPAKAAKAKAKAKRPRK